MVHANESLREGSVASVVLLSALALGGCDNESSRAPVDESVVGFRAEIDAGADELRLETNLRRIVSQGLTTPVLLDPQDALRIEVAGRSASLAYSSEERRYSAALSPLSIGKGKLTYDRRTGGERSETGLIVTHVVRDLVADTPSHFLTSDAGMTVRWALDLLGDDAHQLPSSTALRLRPSVCTQVDGTAEPVQAEFGASTIVQLDSQSLLSETAVLPTERIEAALHNRADRSIYSTCTAHIWLQSDWTTGWDGVNAPTGRDGPVWIEPDPAFANERMEGHSWFEFGMRNLSATLEVEIVL